ncbi:TetR/AcrR family transcriptional regulator [Amycolatopsis sp. DSM 110486]|uniref:TetR/AcrR family transcriptional regulator n=1 Tax=Amycolatopsis sp. DSM 110486 TaxID=2865832 RepID=UPI001C6A2507|nr:TetR family transcriptional regulator [Amycolatopsis sp. DSM 110486]QYN18263.1 TetR family transcriptional regulator [Amycolatopsis sp. DSM 110486]
MSRAEVRGTKRQSSPSARPNRRAELLAAAARLFRERGYGGVSVADIAEQVGITAGAVYKHFPDKRALLAEPIREMVLTWRNREVLALAQGGDTDDVLRRLATSVVGVVLERPDVVRLWHQEAHYLTSEVREELVAVRVEGVGLWLRVLVDARAELTTSQAEFRIRAALGLLNSVPALPRRRLSAHAATLETVLLATLLAPEPPKSLPEIRVVDRESPAAAENTRSRAILDEAAKLFRERGYHAVGIDDIAAGVGIAGPSIYSHFPSKAAVLTAVVEEIADELCWGGALAMASDGTPHEVLERLVTTHVRTAIAKSDLIAVWMTEEHHVPEDLGEAVRRDRKRYLDYWVGAVLAVNPGVEEAVAETASLAVMELIDAVARSRRFAAVPERPEWTVGLALAALTSVAV